MRAEYIYFLGLVVRVVGRLVILSLSLRLLRMILSRSLEIILSIVLPRLRCIRFSLTLGLESSRLGRSAFTLNPIVGRRMLSLITTRHRHRHWRELLLLSVLLRLNLTLGSSLLLLPLMRNHILVHIILSNLLLLLLMLMMRGSYSWVDVGSSRRFLPLVRLGISHSMRSSSMLRNGIL